MAKVLSWAEVKVIHRTVAGIYARGGVAKSIICSPLPDSRYANEVAAKEIKYRVDSRTQGHGIMALLAAVEKKSPVAVFEKIERNKWRSLGEWRIYEIVEKEEENAVVFILRPV